MEVHFSCPFKGIAGGPEDQLCAGACQRSRRPHGPSKTWRASPQGMYKLTRWVYSFNLTNLIVCELPTVEDFSTFRCLTFKTTYLETWCGQMLLFVSRAVMWEHHVKWCMCPPLRTPPLFFVNNIPLILSFMMCNYIVIETYICLKLQSSLELLKHLMDLLTVDPCVISIAMRICSPSQHHNLKLLSCYYN